MLHAQGQATMARLTTLLNDVGVNVSKRQVVRLLTKGLDGFVAEDAAVLHSGLVSATYITVDDTGARHARDNCHTTQIGAEHFTSSAQPPHGRRADPALVANSAATNHDAFATRCRSSNIWSARVSTFSTGSPSVCSRKPASVDPFAITDFSATL